MSRSYDEMQPTNAPVETLIFGELLYDCFSDSDRVLGGAPFNVAWSLQGLGQNATLISAVGDDALGEEAIEKMKAWRLATDGVTRCDEYSTGRVRVEVRDGEPEYTIDRDVAWDYIPDDGFSASSLLYHGSLALRRKSNETTLQKIVDRSRDALRFFDVNLRAPHDDRAVIDRWLENADWVKLNLSELRTICDVGDASLQESEAAVTSLRNRYAAKNFIVTAGEDGARIYTENTMYEAAPAATATPFVDSVGAGDAFTAYIIHAIQSEWSLATAIQQASRFAAKVCGIQGATSGDHRFYDLSYDQ